MIFASSLPLVYLKDFETFNFPPQAVLTRDLCSYLDYTNRGWLLREGVEQCCKEAAEKAGHLLGDPELVKLTNSMDLDKDHEIN